MLQYKQNFYEMRNFPMSLKDYEPRIAKSALHRKEEHVKQVFRDQVAESKCQLLAMSAFSFSSSSGGKCGQPSRVLCLR